MTRHLALAPAIPGAVPSTGGVVPVIALDNSFRPDLAKVEIGDEVGLIGPEALDGLTLSSCGIRAGHADLWIAWDQGGLRNEVSRCLHRDLVCAVGGEHPAVTSGRRR